MPIQLPPDPRAKDYEDFVTASLRALGYFVEPRLTLREGKVEVLELDVIATPASDEWCNRIIVEAKSGTWGFRDIFTLYGWRMHVGIDRGFVVHREEIDETMQTAVRSIGDSTSIECRRLSLSAFDADQLPQAAITIGADLIPKVIANDWYGRIARRLCLADFNRYCRDHTDLPWVKDARLYRQRIQQSAFGRTPLERVRQLYTAWQESPNLPGQAVEKLARARGCGVNRIWRSLENTAQDLWLQYIMALDYIARIRIIKNALDCALGCGPKRDGDDPSAELLPQKFRHGLELLQQNPYREKIPFLFQLFTELLGGFCLTSADDDFELMSALTGIPADKVRPALEMMNDFFEFGEDWFIEQRDEIMRLRVNPSLFLGTGCFFRKSVYDLDSYNDRFPKMGWLLSRWHNALYETLEAHLTADTEET